MEESVFSDTTKGRQLVQKCKEPAPEQVAQASTGPEALPYTRSLYVSMVLNHTDNIYQENTNELAKYFYTVTVGGEYVRKDKIDYGIGASYEYSNAIDLGDYKDEFYNVYLPVYYSSGPHRYSAQVYYNKSITNNTDAYSTWGGFGNYFYDQPSYSVGLVGGASNRVSLDQAFDYRAGFYSTARLVFNKYIDDLTLSGYAGFDQNLSGDQPLGTNTLPYSNKATRYGASAAYNFTQASRVTLRANLTDRDYQNVYSPIGTDRKDTLTNYSLAYQHTFNGYVRAFIQQSYSDNHSNYALLFMF